MKKKILIAPLNWGLGHAARCIPIIHALLQHNFTPIIASDGAALSLLKKEFPDLEALELPSYNISYSRIGYLFKFKLFTHTPHVLKTIRLEHRAIKTIVENHAINGIISDNRFGIFHKDVPSVFITHQLKVLSGSTTWLSSKLHQKIIKNFDMCWVPDHLEQPHLSGKMGHIDKTDFNITYIGPLSRFRKLPSPPKFDVTVLLSGPEPQREILERKLLSTFKNYDGKVLFVKGVVEEKQVCYTCENLTVYNYMTTTMLEKSLNASKLIVARSGYTTIMDLAKLGKKAFFIPTPGQFEQEYLARTMRENKWAPSCTQNDFSLEKLTDLDDYTGLKNMKYELNYKTLFNLFEGK